MDIKEKIMAIPLEFGHEEYSSRDLTAYEVRELCAEVAQKEMDALVAEIDNLVKYDCGIDTEPYSDYTFAVMEEELHGDYYKQSDIKAIIDKWSTK